jgi:predicted Zn-dependent protease
MRQSAKNLLQIAADELGAKLDALGGNHDQAVMKLRHSIALEDALEYTEPPPWHRSMREVLGSTLLEAKRPADAETVLREDLKIYPENGWGLYQLARAVRDQGREAEAARIHTRFKRAWGHADFQIGK